MNEDMRDLGLDCLMEELAEAGSYDEGACSSSSPFLVSTFRPAFFNLVQRLDALLRIEVLHDFQDVLEFGVEAVLNRYDLRLLWVLSVSERAVLRSFLLGVGGRAQTAEMARIVVSDSLGGALRDVPEMKWSIKAEELFRKVFFAELRARRNAVVSGGV